MSFAFGFSGDDVEDDGCVQEEAALVADVSRYSISDPQKTDSCRVEPKKHSLIELVSAYLECLMVRKVGSLGGGRKFHMTDKPGYTVQLPSCFLFFQ